MSIHALPQQSVYASLALLCSLCACITDVRERRIPNVLSGAAILVGLLLHTCLDGWHGLVSSSAAGTAACALFFIFYLAGGMGAGDVKLMAAIGCVNGLASLQTVLLATIFSGGMIALALAVRRGKVLRTLRNVGSIAIHHGQRGLQPHTALNVSNRNLLRIPYAIPIACGCMAAVWSA